MIDTVPTAGVLGPFDMTEAGVKPFCGLILPALFTRARIIKGPS